MHKGYRVLGACSCWGAQIRTCERGPEDLRDAHVFERLKKAGIPILDVHMLYSQKMASDGEIPLAEALPLIYEFNLRLAKLVSETLKRNEFPVAVTGDHSSAVGTWNGIHNYLVKKTDLPLGLIWIDAHVDSHTPETTPSGAWHGMPLASLLGFGAKEMAQLLEKESVLKPENVVLVGVRSFEEGEMKLLKELRVKIYFIEEVRERGLHAVLHEAISRVTNGTCGFGVSLDLDVIDPKDAPGVGSPEEEGVRAEEFLKALPLLRKHPKLVGLEVVEYNPERDVDHKTRELVFQILKGIL